MSESIVALLEAVNDSPLAVAVRESIWLFPIIEAIHVLALVIVVGSIARLDLRLLGLASRDRPISDVSAEMLPWTWAGFVVATVCGVLLFISKPLIYLTIPYFSIKMAILVLAGLNMAAFQLVIARDAGTWASRAAAPRAAQVSAGLSLTFWIAIVVLGRFIGFV
jgi:hypothetical protein